MQKYVVALKNTWFKLNQYYQFSDFENIFDILIRAYSEPQRAYHTVQHLFECLTLLESVKHYLNDPHAVELALWFHDAVYNPQANDNEIQSAQLFERLLISDLDLDVVKKIKRWIIATQKHQSCNESDLQYLLDIDLAILAAPLPRFMQYEQQIQYEFSWVEPTLYLKKRQEILLHFYESSCLYQTAYFQQRYTSQAKLNLEKILKTS